MMRHCQRRSLVGTRQVKQWHNLRLRFRDGWGRRDRKSRARSFIRSLECLLRFQRSLEGESFDSGRWIGRIVAHGEVESRRIKGLERFPTNGDDTGERKGLTDWRINGKFTTMTKDSFLLPRFASCWGSRARGHNSSQHRTSLKLRSNHRIHRILRHKRPHSETDLPSL